MAEPEIETADFIETMRVKFADAVPKAMMSPEEFSQRLESMDFDPKILEDVQTWERPDKLPFGVSPRGAELYVAKWLRWMDFTSIIVTPPRRDGGYDIEADEYVVQVKNWNRDWVSVATIREIFGVAQLLEKKAMVFSRGYLSEDAGKFAVDAAIPVFLFNAEEAILSPANSHAEDLLKLQLAKKWSKLFNLNLISMNQAAMTQVEALLGATRKLSQYFDETFVHALERLVVSLQGAKEDLLAGELEAQARSLLGLTFEEQSMKILETLGRGENIRKVYGIVGEFFDEHYIEITNGLSKVYGNALD